MIPMTLEDIARVTGGTLSETADPNATVTSYVEFDSRKITVGGLFVALPGSNVDGHDFAESAIARGAVGALVVLRGVLQQSTCPCFENWLAGIKMPTTARRHSSQLASRNS